MNLEKAIQLAKWVEARPRRSEYELVIEKASTRQGQKYGYKFSKDFYPGRETQEELQSLLPAMHAAFRRRTLIQISVGWNSGYTHSVLIDFRRRHPEPLEVIDNHDADWHRESDPPYFRPFIREIAEMFGYTAWNYKPVDEQLDSLAEKLCKHEGLPPTAGQCLRYTQLYLGTQGLKR